MDSIICPGCNNSLQADVKFCPYCGMAFATASAGADYPEAGEAVPQAETATQEYASRPIPTSTEVDQSLRHHEYIAGGKKRGFRWWYVIIITLLVSGIIYIFYQPSSNIVNEFKNTNAAAGWQFTAYSPQSFARTASGLTLYDGIYTYKDSFQDATVTINAAIKTDIPIEQNGYLCIWLRYNPNLRKGYCFILKPVTKTAHLGIAGDPSPQSVDLSQLMPDFNPYQAHTYTAAARGENLLFAIDGKQVASLYDVGLIKGQVALEARGLGASITKAEITPER